MRVAQLIFLAASFVFLGGVLPARWAWRIWLAMGIIGGTAIQLAPTGRWEEQGFLDGLEEAAYMAMMATTFIGAVLRWILARLVWPSLRPPAQLSKVEIQSLRAADQIMACILGVCGGLFLVLAIALALRGAQAGLLLHLFIAGVATVAAVWVFRNLVGQLRLSAGVALAIIALLAILGGTLWPSMIRTQAEGIMPGLPRCLRVLDKVATEAETMLLTLPEGRYRSPGLILTIMAEDGARHFRWSYRANQFVRFETYLFGDCPT